MFVFTFGISPVPPGVAKAADSEMTIALKEVIRDRLAHIYGEADNIPPMAGRIARGYPSLESPKSGTSAIIRGAFLYLLPDNVQRKADTIWTRAAKVMDGIIGAKEAKAEVVPPASRRHLRPQDAGATRRHLAVRPVYRGPGNSRPDIPVWQKTDGPPAEVGNSGGPDTLVGWKAGDFTTLIGSSRDKSVPPTIFKPQTSSPVPWLLATGYSFFKELNSLLVPEAKAAWSEPLASADRIHFYHTDHLGSTRLVTDAEGEIYERIDYLPFGEIFRDDVASGPDTDYERHRFKFTGQMYDYLTGLYYYGARYYDAEMGRFTQADTVVPEPLDGQTFNRYAYCFNNPYKYVDPSGHNALVDFFVGLVEAIVVAICFAINPVLGMAVSGLISAIHAAIAGASGAALVGAFMQGFVMAGIASAKWYIGVGMAAYGVYQAVASNDPSAMAACVGGLIGGVYGQKLQVKYQAKIDSIKTKYTEWQANQKINKWVKDKFAQADLPNRSDALPDNSGEEHFAIGVSADGGATQPIPGDSKANNAGVAPSGFKSGVNIMTGLDPDHPGAERFSVMESNAGLAGGIDADVTIAYGSGDWYGHFNSLSISIGPVAGNISWNYNWISVSLGGGIGFGVTYGDAFYTPMDENRMREMADKLDPGQ